MKKKILFIIIALVIILGALAGYNYWKKTSEVEVLGEAQIVVYKKGEKIVLDPKSPYYKELQAACEEMLELKKDRLVSLDFIPKLIEGYFEIDHPIVEKLRSEEWAIKLIYTKTQDIYPGRYTPILFSHLLIPLTGKFSSESYEGKTYTRLFPLLSSKEIIDYYRHNNKIVVDPNSIGTIKNTRKIKEILRKFEIGVP